MTTRGPRCTFHSDYTFDASHCWSLGPSRVSHSITYFSRFLNYKFAFSNDGETVLVPYNATEFDKCLPGPPDCNFVYFGGACPEDYTALSLGYMVGTTTEYCCAKASPLTRMMSFSILSYPYYKDVYTNEAEAKLGSSSRNVTGNVCMYHWNASTATILPTDATGDGVFNNVLLVPAITALNYFTKPATPGIRSSLPTTTRSSPLIITSTDAVSAYPPQSLSKPARIGIGVGASISGALLLSTIGIIFFLLRKRRTQHQRPEVNDNEWGKAELQGNEQTELHWGGAPNELVGESVYEIEDTSLPVEIRDSSSPVEIEDSSLPIEIAGGAPEAVGTAEHTPQHHDTGAGHDPERGNRGHDDDGEDRAVR